MLGEGVMRKFGLILMSCLSLNILGCYLGAGPNEGLQETKVAAPPPVYIHRIRYPGETLARIARWYTGSSANWRRIVQSNVGLNPNRLRIGQEIRIPERLLIRHRPLPRPRPKVVKAVEEPEIVPEAEETQEEETNSESKSVQAESPIEVEKTVTKRTPRKAGEIPIRRNKTKKKAAKQPSEDDKERERLLDELLSQ